MKTRTINIVLNAKPTLEGAGVHLNRAFGYHDIPKFDPFLMLDDFRSDEPAKYLKGFPWHPHRGIETITYLLEGSVEHGDSMGNKGSISSGDVQWMTAGSGIIHQEMPKGDDQGRMYGFQLWANLPASNKMMQPRYRDIKNADIPIVDNNDGIIIKVIAGNVGEIEGPVKDIIIDPEFLDITLEADKSFRHPTKPGHTVFIYVIDGEACFSEEDNRFRKNKTLILFNDGEEILVMTDNTHVRFILLSGKPLNEPIAWGGPIVMNTQEELNLAFRELDNDTFIK